MNNTREKILQLLKEIGEISPNKISQEVGIKPAMLFRHLKKLLSENKITKVGSSPKVFYKINDIVTIESGVKSNLHSKIIEENFSLITATGQEISGMNGFLKWCVDRKLNTENMITKYQEQFDSYGKFFKHGFIDASEKMHSSFGEKSFLDKLFYLDFYSYPIFGRTKISNWLFYGKTLQQLELMNRVIDTEKNKIYNLILEQKIDAVLFVPPTVPRKIQFMKVLEDSLNLNIPKIKIVKVKTPIIIQQKSLKDLRERVENAQNSLVVETRNTNYQRILIIDDFTGSGATLNVIAEKCKKQNVAIKVFGLTITGSINGFEIIREV